MEEQDLSFGMLTPTSQQEGSKQTTPGKSTSKTVTDTIIGEHQHTIVGYSLIKGIGDGEPIASERFEVGGHEWVLLFYPDGKRSSSEVHNLNTHHAAAAVMAAVTQGNNADFGRLPGGGTNVREDRRVDAEAPAADAPATAPAPPAQPAMPRQVVLPPPPMHHHSAGNEYCALFVALIGETDSPQGVVNTSEGRVVRAFHRFTLVDQTGRGQDVSKGRRRDQGAVKISCARQDPNARNCHGYRKFVKKSILEDPGRGLLVNDTIVIKYQIELVVSTGGALSRQVSAPRPPSAVIVPSPSLGPDLLSLLENNIGTDVCFDVDGEKMEAHKIILQARSPVFKALLTGPMKEGHEGVVSIKDVRAPVFKSLLHFAYTDNLPSDFQDTMLEVPMAQHLLAAADRFQLIRLRCMCEQRLCDSVSVDTVATTLALAEQNNAKELKRVCLEFVSKNLQSVMASEGYDYLIETCPQLQSELLTVIATTPPAINQRSRTQVGQTHGRSMEDSLDAQLRRVRPRRE